MNTRIQELAKQTGYIWHASGDPQVYEFTPEKLDEFAELIVRECGAVAYKAYWSNPETVRGRHIEEKIREHFGVE
jgi:hypothetical protein